ncbi:hypothetical protein FOXG_15370 [Fusarium oxysporum f. sp. lycopersici 4287]|uniref:Uncharacterized protein n=2 Tax=Fusarium oxysporum TaxID=5507 RepID=A0A0J9WU73_FUSO4|nr:hypothetical protein FOXG_15370 [Fusarium oxysporum f. sp. lycopersici 4287]EXK43269.1 hypothetical protein FOMG_05901 [Fusarium oxysporum f. sp. melonis 26406]KNB17282.1 hypothetical protein FOXG_15370 [Fusarium oxysporum f. sp. lycopersici 4287]
MPILISINKRHKSSVLSASHQIHPHKPTISINKFPTQSSSQWQAFQPKTTSRPKPSTADPSPKLKPQPLPPKNQPSPAAAPSKAVSQPPLRVYTTSSRTSSRRQVKLYESRLPR